METQNLVYHTICQSFHFWIPNNLHHYLVESYPNLCNQMIDHYVAKSKILPIIAKGIMTHSKNCEMRYVVSPLLYPNRQSTKNYKSVVSRNQTERHWFPHHEFLPNQRWHAWICNMFVPLAKSFQLSQNRNNQIPLQIPIQLGKLV